MLHARLFTNNSTRISNMNLLCVRFYIELVFQFVWKRCGLQEERTWKRKETENPWKYPQKAKERAREREREGETDYYET